MLDELRNYFYTRRELLKELQDAVYNVINYWYNKGKDVKYEVGVIAVICILGRNLKWNLHVHDLVTEGAINKNNNWWRNVDYIPYTC